MRFPPVYFIPVTLVVALSCSRGPESDPDVRSATTPLLSTSALPAPKTVMHRTKAGEADFSGWYAARSTEGDFEIRLPAPFNDFTIIATADDGAEIKTCVVGSVTPGGVTFSALAARRPDGKFRDDPLITQMASFEKRGALKSKQSVEFAGMTGVELRVEDTKTSGFLRVFKTRDTIYQLMVEVIPPTTLDDVAWNAARFFESLKVDQKNAK
jgi:hypothetical protein